MVHTENLMRIQSVVKIVLNRKGTEKAHSFIMENYMTTKNYAQ